MSIDATFAIALFLGAVWIALLNSIVELTRDHPAERTLLVTAFVHFVVLFYFLLATAVLYGKTMASVVPGDLPWVRKYEEILAISWPVAFLGATVAFVTTKVTGIINPVASAGPFVFLALWFLGWAKSAGAWLVILVVLTAFMPYVLLMSFIWAGVRIETDKKFYQPGDVAIITVLSEGYVFSPRITELQVPTGECKTYQVTPNWHTGYFRVVHPIPSDREVPIISLRRSYIKAIYIPQVFSFRREHYEEFTVVP